MECLIVPLPLTSDGRRSWGRGTTALGQNWQSEFLAVASIVVFSVYLRRRGSSQSKPVGEAHATTSAEG